MIRRRKRAAHGHSRQRVSGVDGSVRKEEIGNPSVLDVRCENCVANIKP
jgi:hypothetical protein